MGAMRWSSPWAPAASPYRSRQPACTSTGSRSPRTWSTVSATSRAAPTSTWPSATCPASTPGGDTALVYLVFNTIGNLLTQDDQVRCFQNAANHLADDGVFVLECLIPTAPTRPGHQFVDAERVELDHVMIGVGQYNSITQILDLNHVRISADGVVMNPIRLRMAQPSEFDLMARIAGLTLRDRWGGWRGEPFDTTSWRHISVYSRAIGTAEPTGG